MRNFRVKLHGVNPPLVVFNRRHDFARRRGLMKTIGKTGNMVAVAHPNVEFKRQIGKKLGLSAQNLEFCVSVFAFVRRRNLPA